MVLERDSKKQELLNSILKGKIKKESEKNADAFVHLDLKEAPLSYAQNRMWFLHQFDDGDDSYNMHIVLKMDGELSKEALMYSISKIVERHESLRTNFKMDESGELKQHVREISEVQIENIDVSEMEEAEISEVIENEISKPFDLEKDLLIRAALLTKSDECNYLVAVMHHIVSDGWSLGILGKELMTYYERYLKGDYYVEKPEYQYIDYTMWQKNFLESGKVSRQCEYWKKKMTPLPEPLEIKVKDQNGADDSYEASKLEFFADKELLESLKKLATDNGVTLYMVLFAAYAVLLNRYSCNNDLVIGTPVANRRRKEVEDLIGFFVNTLPIRIGVDAKKSVKEFLAEVKKETVGAFSNQDIPFEYIVKDVVGERYGEQTPIIQTMFVLQNTENVSVTLPGVSVETKMFENNTAKFDILLNAAEIADELRLYFEYRKSIFDPEIVRSIADKYLLILKEMAGNTDAIVESIACNEKVIVNTDPLFAEDKLFTESSIAERFANMAKAYPDKIAVSCNGEEMTYDELDRKSNKVSRYIDRFLDNKPGFVGICLERSLDMIVCILGVIKSNCAYVPLDPDAPKDRMEFIVKDAELKLLIGHKEKTETIPIPENVPVIDIEDKRKDIEAESELSKECTRLNDATAYMIFTSGSTGNPKGVMISDNNVLRLFSNTENLYRFSSEDVWTMFHSVAFDFSVWEIWGALLYGGELVIVPYKTSRTVDAFLELLLEKKVTVLNQTPSAFRQLLQCDKLYEPETVEQMNLKYIIFGGEALDFGMLEQWMNAYGDTNPTLVNMYGITETTVHVTYEVLDKEKIKDKRRSLIGMPIRDLQIYVLDDKMRMVPDGVVGEMYVGGAGVSKGYWNREELTASRFIQNPFTDKADRLYKTGDLAVRYPGGELEYIGRNDEQVKVKGFRIELNEIQEKINENEIVKDNIVVLDKVGDEARIISYFTMDADRRKNVIGKLLAKDDYNVETEEVFNHNYSKNNNVEDYAFNIVGWNNSYDNKQMSAAEMRQWLDSICGKLHKIPMKSVLEIGVGTGMIMHSIAGRVDRYLGIDISKEAIDYNNRVIEQNKLGYDNVSLLHASVDELEDSTECGFDTVIINSVAQYFPDISYFENALLSAIDKMGDKGNVIVGDVRNYNRLDMYYLSVELAHTDKTATIATLKKNIDTKRENEKELIFSTEYFRELLDRIPEISGVSITPKNGDINNELSKYRYDVVLSIDKKGNDKVQTFECEKRTWTGDIDNVMDFEGDAIHYSNVSDERVEYEKDFLNKLKVADENLSVESFEKVIKAGKRNGLSYKKLEEIEKRVSEAGYRLFVGVDNVPGFLDLVICKEGTDRRTVDEYLNRSYGYNVTSLKVTEPLKYKVQYSAVEQITQFLQDKLPYYMIPNEFVLIDKIPLTINGKTDYRALPKPNASGRTIVNKEDWCEEYIVQEVTKVWKNLLHIEDIKPDDDFFRLGGHSLLATNLIFSLNDIFDVRIPLKELFENPTIMGNCKYIQNKLGGSSQVVEKELNLEKDVVLPEIVNEENIENPTNDGNRILVTGATGFFGAFMVQRLLEDTKATIYCLVRANDEEHARKRLLDTLREYRLYKNEYEDRLVVIKGDLEKPYLGMDKKKFDRYASEVDTIVHNGAKVNFFEPYENLKKANVYGTKEIIRFAMLHRIKPVHFISTLYVYEPSQDTSETQIIEENKPLAGYRGLRMGYTQSKWVAENVLNLARNKGLPVNIYRLGRISGHSKTGACQKKDFMWSLVKGCIEIGVYPDQNLEFEFTPVDFLTDAVVKIMKSGEMNKQYHLFNNHKTGLKNIVRAMSDHYEMKKLSREKWVERISSEGNSARHLAQLLSDGTFEGGYMEFKNDNVVKHVPDFEKGISVDDEMIRELRDYFVEEGYFPATNERKHA